MWTAALPFLLLLTPAPRRWRTSGSWRMAPRGDDASAADGSAEDFEMDVDIQELFRYSANVKAVCQALRKQGVEEPGAQVVLMVEDSPEWLFLQAAYDQGVRTFAVKSGAALRDLHRDLPADANFHLVSKFNRKLVQRLKRLPQVSAVRVGAPEDTVALAEVLQGEASRRAEKPLSRVSKSRAGFLRQKEGPDSAGPGRGAPRVGVLLDLGRPADADEWQSVVHAHQAALDEHSPGGVIQGIILGAVGDTDPGALVDALRALPEDDGGMVTVTLSLPKDDPAAVFKKLKSKGVALNRVAFVLPLQQLAQRLDFS